MSAEPLHEPCDYNMLHTWLMVGHHIYCAHSVFGTHTHARMHACHIVRHHSSVKVMVESWHNHNGSGMDTAAVTTPMRRRLLNILDTVPVLIISRALSVEGCGGGVKKKEAS